MQKIKINQKDVENVKFSFNNQEIEVIPHISSSLQEKLIKIYLDSYFYDGREDRLGAEKINKMSVLEFLTNIETGNEAEEIMKNIEDISSSGLWDRIEKSIKNYREYLYNLSIALEYKKKEKSDVGYILRDFIEKKVSPILDKFSDIDFSDEKLKEMKSMVGEITAQLNPNTPVGSIIKNGTV